MLLFKIAITAFIIVLITQLVILARLTHGSIFNKSALSDCWNLLTTKPHTETWVSYYFKLLTGHYAKLMTTFYDSTSDMSEKQFETFVNELALEVEFAEQVGMHYVREYIIRPATTRHDVLIRLHREKQRTERAANDNNGRSLTPYTNKLLLNFKVTHDDQVYNEYELLNSYLNSLSREKIIHEYFKYRSSID